MRIYLLILSSIDFIFRPSRLEIMMLVEERKDLADRVWRLAQALHMDHKEAIRWDKNGGKLPVMPEMAVAHPPSVALGMQQQRNYSMQQAMNQQQQFSSAAMNQHMRASFGSRQSLLSALGGAGSIFTRDLRP
jgi:hypothetical protein